MNRTAYLVTQYDKFSKDLTAKMDKITLDMKVIFESEDYSTITRDDINKL